jgi:phosphatidate cytidylyltransferase
LAISGLRARVVSGIVMMPVGVAAVIVGGWPFTLLATAVGVLMLYEWDRVSAPDRWQAAMAVHGCILAAAIGSHVFRLTGFEGAVGLLLAGSLIGGVLLRIAARIPFSWGMAGPLYVGLALLAAIWLRDADAGLLTVLWLLLAIWGTDVGAYFAGKGIGGPRIAPSISPNKTWAGLIGGMLAAGLVSAAMSWWYEPNWLQWLNADGDGRTGQGLLRMAAAGLIIALIAQAGDFAESAWKRHFKVKDSSGLIPGHGGVLDRLDGVLCVFPVAALLQWLMKPGVPGWQ